ncbi:MAG: hypothetical protein E7678_00795 [Ruminococcaceae bacterium]|nr:hypothetical protein [Oscillospiraceae bacterium]
MLHKNKSLLRTFVRIFALILVLSMMLVGCDDIVSKDDFPDFEPNAVGGDGGNKGNQNNNSKPNNNAKPDDNNANDINPNNSSNNSGKKRVAITYDDGPHNVRTVAIVDELEKYGFNATFFVVGNRVDGTAYDGAKALKYASDKGNEIAIHAYTHDYYYDSCDSSIYSEELSNTKAAILKQIPKAKVNLMRPVGGRITEDRTANCDYSVIMWSVDSNDWKYKNDGASGVETIVDNVMSQVKNGSIILMHDIYENTVEATKKILKELNSQGYEVVTVSELLGSPKAGVKYSKAS